MRSIAGGGCTLQQALTPAAATVVKEAVTLARRRGHAQVAPLHVASTMLSSSSSSGLLRTACQESHTHPLQCRALELCFNVALNRLPTTASSSSSSPMSPMLGPSSLNNHHGHQPPGISNALVAAFKRAQAHQRRGSVENQQQQALLTVKIELEQLVVSILDDPSVSRVMKEAGFSSTLVKAKVQQAVTSTEVTNSTTRDLKNSTSSKKSKPSNHNQNGNKLVTAGKTTTTISADVISRSDEQPTMGDHQTTTKEDSVIVIEGLMAVISNKKSRPSGCLVVVGECLATLECTVEDVIGKVNRCEPDVPELLRKVKFVPLHLESIEQCLTKEGIEKKVKEIKGVLKSCVAKPGMVLYLGDFDRWASYTKLRADHVEHMIMELRRLVYEYAQNDEDGSVTRLWLLGVATVQTYRKKSTQYGQAKSDLEAIWGTTLHAITIPSAGSATTLGLSLIPDHSDLQCSSPGQTIHGHNFHVHGGGIKEDDKTPKNSLLASRGCNSELAAVSSSRTGLPSWLQKCVNNNKDYQQKTAGLTLTDQSKTWVCSSAAESSLCSSSSPLSSPPQCFQRTLSFTSATYPPPSPGFSFGHLSFQQPPNQHQTVLQCGSFWLSSNQHCRKPAFGTSTYIPDPKEHQNRQSPISPPNYSTSSSEKLEIIDYCSSTSTPRLFKEYTAENHRTICNALERKVPWQKDIIPDIVSTILRCRAGSRLKGSDNQPVAVREETWFFFQGADVEGKLKVARELAGLFFRSTEQDFVSIGVSNFSSSPKGAVDSAEEAYSRNKRSRDERNCNYLERLCEAVTSDPHRVFFLDDIGEVDYCSQAGLKRAAERGKLILRRSWNWEQEEVGFGDAIIILSCDRFRSRSRGCCPNMTHLLFDNHGEPIIEDQEEKRNNNVDRLTSQSISLDLNLSISDDYGSSVVQCGSDHDRHDLSSIDEIGLISSVDKCVVFKLCEQ